MTSQCAEAMVDVLDLYGHPDECQDTGSPSTVLYKSQMICYLF